MKRPGRNEACHCGSGKKYKKCCLQKDQATDLEHRRATQELAEAQRQEKRAAFLAKLDAMQDQVLADEAFIDESNAVVDMIHDGRLDEAEVAARALIERYPGATDGLERLGHVFEARGDMKTAAKHYRDAINQGQRLGLNNDDHHEWLRQLAERIDPP